MRIRADKSAPTDGRIIVLICIIRVNATRCHEYESRMIYICTGDSPISNQFSKQERKKVAPCLEGI